MALRWRMLITQNQCLRVSIKNRERKKVEHKNLSNRVKLANWLSRAELMAEIAFNLVSVPQLSGVSLGGDLKNFSPRRRRKKRKKKKVNLFFVRIFRFFYQCQHFCCDLIDSCKWMCWTLKRAREAWTCSTLEKSIFCSFKFSMLKLLFLRPQPNPLPEPRLVKKKHVSMWKLNQMRCKN